MQNEQIFVAGNQNIRFTDQRQFEEFVVFLIAARIFQDPSHTMLNHYQMHATYVRIHEFMPNRKADVKRKLIATKNAFELLQGPRAGTDLTGGKGL